MSKWIKRFAKFLGYTFVLVTVLAGVGLWMMYDEAVKDEMAENARPLFEAAETGDIEGIRKALESGIDINTPDTDGTTALMYATRAGEKTTPTIMYLLKQGADPTKRDEDGRNILHYVMSYAPDSDKLKLTRLLLKHDVDINAANSDGETPLMLASWTKEGIIGLFNFLMDKGADVNAEDKEGKTPLSYVIEHSPSTTQIDLIKNLVNQGADINHRDNYGVTPIFTALEAYTPSEPERAEVIQELVKLGAKLNVTVEKTADNFYKKGDTPLHVILRENGSFFGDWPVTWLVSQGADVNARNYTGETPLILLSGKGVNLDIARYLIFKGADPKIKDNDGHTALDYFSKWLKEKHNIDLKELDLDRIAKEKEETYKKYNQLNEKIIIRNVLQKKEVLYDDKDISTLNKARDKAWDANFRANVAELALLLKGNKLRDEDYRKIIFWIVENGSLSALKQDFQKLVKHADPKLIKNLIEMHSNSHEKEQKAKREFMIETLNKMASNQ